jgi:hypothetical protein
MWADFGPHRDQRVRKPAKQVSHRRANAGRAGIHKRSAPKGDWLGDGWRDA